MAIAMLNWATAGTGASTAIKKNSGILRYHFGINGVSGNAKYLDGQTGFLVCCLGDDLATMADSDGQLFGMTAGHATIVGKNASAYPGSLFDASLYAGPAPAGLTACDAAAIGAGGGVRFPPNYPGAGAATGQSRLAANGRIPAGTKVYAWWQTITATQGASSTADEQPLVVVQTEVYQNTPINGGVAAVGGESWLSSIRVAVANIAASTSTAYGILYVRLEHSYEDLPGLTANPNVSDSNGSAYPAAGGG